MKTRIFSVLLALALFLAACSTPKPTSAPATAPILTEAPIQTEAPVPTEAPLAEVTVNFANNSNSALDIFWVDNEQEQSYGSVAAGETFNQVTFSTHTWRVRDSYGSLVAEYAATADAQQTLTLTQEMVDAVAPAAQQYYTEEFDADSANWSVLYFQPDGSVSDKPIRDLTWVTKDGFLQFNIVDTYIGAFAAYNAYEYTDVRVDTRMENHGRNTNDVAVMCRYSDAGWYEFNVRSDGLWFFNLYEKKGEKFVGRMLYSGGSNSIKLSDNEYGLLCVGDILTMYINGEKIHQLKDNTLTTGKVAIQAFSLRVVPMIVYFDWLKISQP